jgi:hypothetical protein
VAAPAINERCTNVRRLSFDVDIFFMLFLLPSQQNEMKAMQTPGTDEDRSQSEFLPSLRRESNPISPARYAEILDTMQDRQYPSLLSSFSFLYDRLVSSTLLH